MGLRDDQGGLLGDDVLHGPASSEGADEEQGGHSPGSLSQDTGAGLPHRRGAVEAEGGNHRQLFAIISEDGIKICKVNMSHIPITTYLPRGQDMRVPASNLSRDVELELNQQENEVTRY